MDNLKREKKLMQVLDYFGFNFSLIGTKYLEEVLLAVIDKPKYLLSLNTTVLNEIALKNNSSVKNIESDIKWTIKNAYNKGFIQEFYVLENNKVPTTKQMIILLFDYIMD